MNKDQMGKQIHYLDAALKECEAENERLVAALATLQSHRDAAAFAGDKAMTRNSALAAELAIWKSNHAFASKLADDLTQDGIKDRARIRDLEAALREAAPNHHVLRIKCRECVYDVRWPDICERCGQPHSVPLETKGDVGSAANATAPGRRPSKPENGLEPGASDGDLACPAALPRLSETDCELCEGSGETGVTHHDGTQYSTKTPPCPDCGGTGKAKGDAGG